MHTRYARTPATHGRAPAHVHAHCVSRSLAQHLHYVDWAPDSLPSWQTSFVRRFISAHEQHAQNVLHKPLLLEEFSAVGLSRETHYALTLRQILASGIHAGLHFWALTREDSPRLCCTSKAVVANRPTDAPIVTLLKHHAAAMKRSAQEAPARELPAEPSTLLPPVGQIMADGSKDEALIGASRGQVLPPQGEQDAAPRYTSSTIQALQAERDVLKARLRLAEAELRQCRGAKDGEGGSSVTPQALEVDGMDHQSSQPLLMESLPTPIALSPLPPPPLPRPLEKTLGAVSSAHQRGKGAYVGGLDFQVPKGGSLAPQGAGRSGTGSAGIGPAEKHGPPCPVDWGTRRDGNRLRSEGETSLAGCCSLCRAFDDCAGFNHDANQGAGRCYLLSRDAGQPRQVKDASQRSVYSSAAKHEGCSCASIGSYRAP